MASASLPYDSEPEPLPQEFTLTLGPHSAEQVAALARVLKNLGAQVVVGADGRLVAVRPESDLA